MKLGRPPEQGPQFDAMMVEIDLMLTDQGIDIPWRSMAAIREIGMRYGLNIPLGGYPVRLPPDLKENLQLCEAIKRWYEDNYGDRLKTNPCPGQVAVLLDGDLYVLRVPRILGEVKFVLTRQWLHAPDSGRDLCNIVQLVDELTPARAARLSDAALNSIGAAFEIALPAAYTLVSTDHQLIAIARGDVDVAVDKLMEGRYGESKWASLQSAEKTLKAAIDLNGKKFGRSHDLAGLCQLLTDAGVAFDASVQVAAIQCRPGIRYGEETCSRDQALAAHHASLELANILREADAKFTLGIGGLKRLR